jgi:hypothetical protein
LEKENEKIETITGYYSIIENPCTTVPCLPGLVYAILVNDKRYYLTVNDYLLVENRSWEGYTPKLNDLVTAKGYVRHKKDLTDQIYHTIETIELLPI